MPIYEYECSECGHYMEAIQRISDDPLKECPACGKPALTKLISADAVRKAVEDSVPPRTVDLNRSAFDRGYQHGIELLS